MKARLAEGACQLKSEDGEMASFSGSTIALVGRLVAGILGAAALAYAVVLWTYGPDDDSGYVFWLIAGGISAGAGD